MERKTPGPAKAGAEGEYEATDHASILPPLQNRNIARLGYLGQLADRQARDAERFDEMCLAAERYRSNPTSANAVDAHAAARRYSDAAGPTVRLTPIDGGRA